jgi:hypothetical protein
MNKPHTSRQNLNKIPPKVELSLLYLCNTTYVLVSDCEFINHTTAKHHLLFPLGAAISMEPETSNTDLTACLSLHSLNNGATRADDIITEFLVGICIFNNRSLSQKVEDVERQVA